MKNKEKKKETRHHNRHKLTHSHDNEMEGKRLIEFQIDERNTRRMDWLEIRQGGKIRRGRKR